MILKDLLRRLKAEKQKRIVVSGPQFSGTTVASYILAKELNSIFVNNSTFDHVDLLEFVKSVKPLPTFCVPCTALLHNIHSLPDDILIIIMDRSIESIMQSQSRLGWDLELQTKQFFQLDKPFGFFNFPKMFDSHYAAST